MLSSKLFCYMNGFVMGISLSLCLKWAISHFWEYLSLAVLVQITDIFKLFHMWVRGHDPPKWNKTCLWVACSKEGYTIWTTVLYSPFLNQSLSNMTQETRTCPLLLFDNCVCVCSTATIKVSLITNTCGIQ